MCLPFICMLWSISVSLESLCRNPSRAWYFCFQPSNWIPLSTLIAVTVPVCGCGWFPTSFLQDFGLFFFFLRENFHRISNPSYLHFNVLLKVLLIKYPIFVHSCNFNSCCWKPSSVCLRYYLLKKQNWAKISGMCWWLVKNTAELGWSGGSILVGRKGEWAPAAPAAMISPAKKFLRTSEKV